jgi:hypothetical protein
MFCHTRTASDLEKVEHWEAEVADGRSIWWCVGRGGRREEGGGRLVLALLGRASLLWSLLTSIKAGVAGDWGLVLPLLLVKTRERERESAGRVSVRET